MKLHVDCLEVSLPSSFLKLEFEYFPILGDKKFRSILTEATKKDAILDKAVVAKKFNERDSRYSPERRNARSWSRTRSRSRSVDRKYGRSFGRGYKGSRSYRGRNGGDYGRKDSRASRSKKKKSQKTSKDDE